MIKLSPETLEAFAIRCALGNNGGTWAEHYTEAQKELWRRFVRDLVAAMPSGEPPANHGRTNTR